LAELSRSIDERPVNTERTDRQNAELQGSADRLAEMDLSRTTDPARAAEKALRTAELEQTAKHLAELELESEKEATQGRPGSRRGRAAVERARRIAELKQSADRLEELGKATESPAGDQKPLAAGPEPKAAPKSIVVASSDDPDAKLPTQAGPESDTSARLAGYQVEAAELLANAAGRRKRRTTTASGLPAPDPATQEPPIRLTRPPRPGLSKPQSKD
jgi:hypothetical protein